MRVARTTVSIHELQVVVFAGPSGCPYEKVVLHEGVDAVLQRLEEGPRTYLRELVLTE